MSVPGLPGWARFRDVVMVRRCKARLSIILVCRRHASGLGEACCSKESAFEVLAAQGLDNGGLAGRGAVPYPILPPSDALVA